MRRAKTLEQLRVGSGLNKERRAWMSIARELDSLVSAHLLVGPGAQPRAAGRRSLGQVYGGLGMYSVSAWAGLSH